MISPLNYELELPLQTKIHPVFNVYNLKPHYGPIPDTLSREPLSDIIDDVEEWEVEFIEEERREEYLVQWKEYPETIWENKAHLKNAPDIVKEWKKGVSNMNHN